jgi:hypothetical protein
MTAEEFVNKVCPEHCRTTCSDDNLTNGLGSGDTENDFRCSKCVLLEVARELVALPPKFYLVGS